MTLELTLLDTLELSPHLVLSGLESAPVIDHSARRTLGKRVVVQVRTLPVGGRQLVLDGINHFTLADLDAIRLLAEAGRAVVLIHHRGTFNVIITGIKPEPTEDQADPDPDSWYSAQIFLQEV